MTTPDPVQEITERLGAAADGMAELSDQPVTEPHNLAPGWVAFDYRAAFGCPVKVVNDAAMQALGSYDGGRMLFLHIVERDLPEAVGRACSDVLVDWAVGQANEVGAARGLAVQQIDTGAFADDERQHRWLAASGFERVRTWWHMRRPVAPEEAELVPSP